MPRPYKSAIGWIWTKRRPANAEGLELTRLSFNFATRGESRRFAVVRSEHGKFLPLICSELLEVDTRAKLLGRVDLVLVPSWNTDGVSFEYFIQSAPLELHAFVAIANNGVFSDCRMRAPFKDHAKREVCRLLERGQNETVIADIPLGRLREFQWDPDNYLPKKEWKPLPPGWPSKH